VATSVAFYARTTAEAITTNENANVQPEGVWWMVRRGQERQDPWLEVSVGRIDPLRLIAIGFVLVLFGFVGPLFMVLGILETSFALSFLSHGASVSGLFLGLIGTAMYVGRRRK
jgi:hypothetical protein